MLSLFALASSVSAASNAFTNPVTNITVDTGSSLNITWTNSSGSTVNISLLSGEVNAMKSVATVGNNIPNQGEYVWTLPSDIKTGQYGLEITSDDGSDNYSSVFTIIDESGASANASSSANTTSYANATSPSTAPAGVPTTNVTSFANNTAIPTGGAISRNSSANATATGPAKTTSGEGVVPITTSSGSFNNGSAGPSSSSSGSRANSSSTASSTKVGNSANVASGSVYVACAAVAGAAMLMI